MKTNVILAVIFLSFTLLAYSGLFPTPPVERIGNTELNGNGCVCHSLFADPSVQVWVEGPETLAVGQTGLYKMFLAGGPAEAGGYNVAGRFGTMRLVDTISVWDRRAPNELTQAFPLVFPTPQDTIFWPFEYTASDSSDVDTIYSCGLSIVYDSLPISTDLWAFGPKFPLTIIDDVTPVELSSLTAEIINNNAVIKWTTASELNNKGFFVEKSKVKSQKSNIEWEVLGFVDGKGTTSESSEYLFIDENLTGKNLYRLKQTDYDGRFQYSEIVEVDVMNKFNFELSQNYPNPFNPVTIISWQLPSNSDVKLKVFDITGRELLTLVNERLEEGNHQVEFNAAHLPSGMYLYSLETGNRNVVKKMLLLK